MSHVAVSGHPISPIPLTLRQELPDQKFPLLMSERLSKTIQTTASVSGAPSYQKVQVLPTDPEWSFVWRYFHHNKPSKYGLRNIYFIHNTALASTFQVELSLTERKSDQFEPQWEDKPKAGDRALAIRRWQKYSSLFSPFDITEANGQRKTLNKTKILPLWHGSSQQKSGLISESGFRYFGKTPLAHFYPRDSKSTDQGIFGSGIYFTNSARYAADIFSSGHLILAWVSMLEPYPVLDGDIESIAGKGAYDKHNAHYIPVVPTNDKPSCDVYYPCKPEQKPVYDELVVFQGNQTLPRFWVELELEATHQHQLSHAPQTVSDLITHVLKMLQESKVDADEDLRKALGWKLEALMKRSGAELKDEDRHFFDLLTALINPNKEVNGAIREAIVLPFFPMIFGKSKWRTYIGDVGVEPPLPPNVVEILNAPCPFWAGKKVYETHMLTLIPATVNGRPLNLQTLGELVKKGKATKYRHLSPGEAANVSIAQSHWVLMGRDILPNTRNKSYSEQLNVLTSYNHLYEVPPVLEATVSIFMEYFRSNGTRLFSADNDDINLWTYTRCSENFDPSHRMIVGGFHDPTGLQVSGSDDNARVGLAPFRRL